MTVKRFKAGLAATGTAITATSQTAGTAGVNDQMYDLTLIGTKPLSYDDTILAYGYKSLGVDIATTADKARHRWDMGAANNMSVEFLMKYNGVPSSIFDLLSVLDNSGSFSGCGKIQLRTDGKLSVSPKSGSATVATTALTSGQVYRICLWWVLGADATSGQLHMAYYNTTADSTLIQQIDLTGVDTGTSQFRYIQVMNNVTGYTVPKFYLGGYWFDNTQAANLGIPSANAGPTIFTAQADLVQLAGTTINLSSRAQDSDGTITAAQWSEMTSGSPVTVSTNTTGLNGNDVTATASPTATAGYHSYRCRFTDDAGATVDDLVDVFVHAASAATVTIRSTSGAGTNVAGADKVTSMNDALDSTYVQTAAGPVNEDETDIWNPFGPDEVKFTYRMDADNASPTVPVQFTVFKEDGVTQVYQTTVTPTTSIADYEIKPDATALGNIPFSTNPASDQRKALRVRKRANTN